MQFKGQGTWTYAPLQEHSHKPEEQYAIIERCSPGPYLELFARRKICALPISRLAEDDAHLWLWVTNGDISRPDLR